MKYEISIAGVSPIRMTLQTASLPEQSKPNGLLPNQTEPVCPVIFQLPADALDFIMHILIEDLQFTNIPEVQKGFGGFKHKIEVYLPSSQALRLPTLLRKAGYSVQFVKHGEALK